MKSSSHLFLIIREKYSCTTIQISLQIFKNDGTFNNGEDLDTRKSYIRTGGRRFETGSAADKLCLMLHEIQH